MVEGPQNSEQQNFRMATRGTHHTAAKRWCPLCRFPDRMPHPDDPHQAPDLHPDDLAWTDTLVVRPSATHGLGVFARRRFEAGEVVERVPLIMIPDEDMHYFRIRGSFMHRYAMPGIPDDEHSALMNGFGTLYNHQPDPALANVVWRYAGGRLMLYVASRTIAPGEELTFDYGEDTGF